MAFRQSVSTRGASVRDNHLRYERTQRLVKKHSGVKLLRKGKRFIGALYPNLLAKRNAQCAMRNLGRMNLEGCGCHNKTIRIGPWLLLIAPRVAINSVG